MAERILETELNHPDTFMSDGKGGVAARSIKIKIDLTDQTEREQLLPLFKITHELYHEGVRYYQDWLLRMKQEDVHVLHDADDEVAILKGKILQEDLWRGVLAARERNTKFQESQNKTVKFKNIDKVKEHILSLISAYYGSICSDEKNIDAKGFLNHLTLFKAKIPGEATSGRDNSFQVKIKKFLLQYDNDIRQLGVDFNIDDRTKFDGYYQVLQAEKLSFNEEMNEQFKTIEKAYEKVQKKVVETQKGIGAIVRELKEYGVFPLFPNFLRESSGDLTNYLNEQGYIIKGTTAAFDYSMWALAVASLRGWNTWNSKKKEEKDKQLLIVEDSKKVLLEKDPDGLYKRLVEYEQLRNEELRQIADNENDTFILKGRVLRGLDDVVDVWKKLNNSTEDTRIKAVSEIQTRQRGRFGDPDFYRWLAKTENQQLCENTAIIKAYSFVQREQRKLQEMKDFAVMTRTDALLHPVWFNLEGPKGTNTAEKVGAGANQPMYTVEVAEDGWYLKIPLLVLNHESKELCREVKRVKVRPSSQIDALLWREGSFYWKDANTGFTCEAKPKGAKLQYARRSLEAWSKRNNQIGVKYFPLPFFNITWELSLDSRINPDSKWKNHFLKAPKDQITHIEALLSWFFAKEREQVHSFEKKIGMAVATSKPEPLTNLLPKEKEKTGYGFLGFLNKPQDQRFMAVDLGVRTFASCSVFRLQREEPQVDVNGRRPLYHEVKPFEAIDGIEEKAYAVHERSFKIDLLGDTVTPLLKEARNKLEMARQELKYKINARRSLRRIGGIGDMQSVSRQKSVAELRQIAVNDFIETYSAARYPWPFLELSQELLRSTVIQHENKPDDFWKNLIEDELIRKRIEPDLREAFKIWRSSSRQAGRIWHTEQLKAHKVARRERFAGKHVAIPAVIPFYGQSFWGINELTEARKVMMSYHTRSHSGGRSKGTHIAKGSSFAIELQAHIQNRKEDRLKKGAHALMMYALGYEWVQCDVNNRPLDKEGNIIEIDEYGVPTLLKETGRRPQFLRTGLGNPYISLGRWVAVASPTRTILFEDLSRYRTREERSRAENGQLMKWAHRAIPAQVIMQSAPYGLFVGEVGAAFSSRFHAKTGAPGLRCNIFTVTELVRLKTQLATAVAKAKEKGEASWRKLANEWPLAIFRDNRSFSESSLEKLFQILSQKNTVELAKGRMFGVILPVRGGEYFVTIDPLTTKPVALNADINAAQNLALRFLTRYQKPQKINMVAVTVGDEVIFFSHFGSKRVIRQTGVLKGELRTYRKKADVEANVDSEIEVKTVDGFVEAQSSKWFTLKVTKTQDFDLLKRMSLKKNAQNEDEADDDELLDVKGIYACFCDPSGAVLSKQYLYSAKSFWSIAKQKIEKKLFEDPLFQVVQVSDKNMDAD